tara:strand:- start:89 stop:283 length:195 start_codon:yes stop_codon:yes gene_type:complete
MNSAKLGVLLIAGGLVVSAFHLNLLLVNRNKAPVLAYGLGVLGGVVFINVGSNLIATNLDRYFK